MNPTGSAYALQVIDLGGFSFSKGGSQDRQFTARDIETSKRARVWVQPRSTSSSKTFQLTDETTDQREVNPTGSACGRYQPYLDPSGTISYR